MVGKSTNSRRLDRLTAKVPPESKVSLPLDILSNDELRHLRKIWQQAPALPMGGSELQRFIEGMKVDDRAAFVENYLPRLLVERHRRDQNLR